MASYTIRLGDLISTGFSIWDSDNPFPVFDETYREHLQTMIIDHYYMQEIGTETPQDFKRMLNQRLREIMPKYNAMYVSAVTWDNDPLVTYRSHTDDNGNVDTDFTEGTRQSVTGSKTDYHYGFDTPMNVTSVQTPDHMSSADKNEYGQRTDTYGHAANQKDNTYSTHDNDTDTTIYGVSAYEKTKQYREMAFNIDKMIIDSLADLFMMIF